MLKSRYEKRDPIGVGTYPLPSQPYNCEAYRTLLEGLCKDPNNLASIYVHIPFCSSLCYFCGLNRSIAMPSSIIDGYLASLKKEIEIYSHTNYIQSLTFRAIYIGGGTPAILEISQLESLMEELFYYFNLDRKTEITIEGTPISFSCDKLQALKNIGVTRISTGVQTLDDKVRSAVGLKVSAAQVLNQIQHIVELFDNVNIDLIYNLPQQKMDSWLKDLLELSGLKITHLTINPFVLLRTARLFSMIENGVYSFPRQEEELEKFINAINMLKLLGWKQYTVRDFCRGKKYCQYIINNSYSNDVLALGTGAFGYLNGITYENVSDLETYCGIKEEFPIRRMKICSVDEKISRYMVMVLRLMHCRLDYGILKTGIDPLVAYEGLLKDLQEEEFIRLGKNSIDLTQKGLIWGNNIRGEFANGANLEYIGYGLKGAGKSGRGNFI